MNTILKLEKRILAILLASVLTLSLFAGMRLTVQAAPEDDTSTESTELTFEVTLTATPVADESVTGRVPGEPLKGTARAYWRPSSDGINQVVTFIGPDQTVPDGYTEVTPADVTESMLVHCIPEGGIVYQQLFVTDPSEIAAGKAAEYGPLEADSEIEGYWLYNQKTGTDSDPSNHIVAKEGYLYKQKTAAEAYEYNAEGTVDVSGINYVYAKTYDVPVTESPKRTSETNPKAEVTDFKEKTVSYLGLSFVLDNFPELTDAVSEPATKTSNAPISISGSYDKTEFFGNKEDGAVSGLTASYGAITYSTASELINLSKNGDVSSKVIGTNSNAAVLAEVKLSGNTYASMTNTFAVKAPVIEKFDIDIQSSTDLNSIYFSNVKNPEVIYTFEGTGLSASMVQLITESGSESGSISSTLEGSELTVKFAELPEGEINIGVPELNKNAETPFSVDTVAPTAKLSISRNGSEISSFYTREGLIYIYPENAVEGESGKELEETDKDQITVTLSAEDDNIVGEIGNNAYTVRTEDASWTVTNNEKKVEIEQTFDADPDKKVEIPISFIVEDRAGNKPGTTDVNVPSSFVSYDASEGKIDGAFVVDRMRPSDNTEGIPTITLTRNTEYVLENDVPLYNQPVSYYISVKDPDSGLKNVSWIIGQGGTETLSEALEPSTGSLEIKDETAAEETITFGLKDPGEYDNLVLKVIAEDNVGNTVWREEKLAIDTLAPRVTLMARSDAEVSNEKYFNRDRFIEVEVEDLFFKEEDVSVIATSGDATGWNQDGIKHKMTCQYVNDANDCGFSMEATDAAGNPAVIDYTPVQPLPFVIDKTAPRLTVTRSYPVQSVQVGENVNEYFADDIEFTAKVEEKNFAENQKIQFRYTTTAESEKELTLNKSDSDTYEGNAVLGGDDYKSEGDSLYQFIVNGMDGSIVDLAGNAAEIVTDEIKDDDGNNINFSDHYKIIDNPDEEKYGAISFVDNYQLIIDKNEPEISISSNSDTDSLRKTDYSNKSTDDKTYFYSQEMKDAITVTVKDINLDSDNTNTYIKYILEDNGAEVPISKDLQESETKGVFEAKITIPENKLLKDIKVSAIDYATNTQTDSDEHVYIADTTAPEVNIEITGNIDEKAGIFENNGNVYVKLKSPADAESGTIVTPPNDEKVNFKVTVEDRNIEINTDAKYEKPFFITKKGEKEWEGTLVLNKDSTVVYEDSVTVKTDDSGTIEFDLGLIDLAGNAPTGKDVKVNENAAILFQEAQSEKTPATVSKRVVVDRERPESQKDEKSAPIIELKASNDHVDKISDEILLYNGSTKYSLAVVDPIYKSGDNDLYSGLESVTATVTEGNLIVDPENPAKITTAESPLEFEAGAQSASGEIPVTISGFGESNNIVLTIVAKDKAGNTTRYSQPLAIDNYKPRITLNAYSAAVPQHGNYYNRPRYVDVTVTDLNFDPSMNYTPINVVNGTKSAWRDNGITHTMTCSYTWDADNCHFDMSAKDRALNSDSKGIDNPTFFIDMTAPVINVTFDNNNARNGKYYNANRVANVNIIEHNFLAAEVQAPVTATLDGAPIAAPGIGGFSRAGDSNNAQIPFVNDGDYAFTVDYTDMAGNPAQRVVIPEFTIDKTTPQAIIGNVENMHAYAGEIRPTVTMTDVNFDPNGYSITWFVTKLGSARAVPIDGRGALTPTGHGVVFTFDDLPRNPENDGIYLLSAVITDMAGNSFTTETVQYSVNRFGSVYKANDEPTRQLLNSGFTKNAPAISILETNPNKVTNIKITIAINGTTKTLQEGKDYTIRKSEPENRWKEYVYDINPKVFMGSDGKLIQGTYVITIYSEDEAGNQNANRTNVEPNMLNVGFVIDIEDPVGFITVKGLGTNSRIQAASTEYTVTWEDNGLIVKVEIFLNGQLVKVLKGKELEEAKGKYTLTVEEQNYQQTISATVYDAAGNKKELEEVSFFLNSSWFQQFIHNTGLLIGVIAGIVVIAGIIVAIVVSRRKKQAEEGSEGGNE